jgi:ribonuclease P protein subunit POP4
MLMAASEVRQTRCRQVLNDARLQVVGIEPGPAPFACAWESGMQLGLQRGRGAEGNRDWQAPLIAPPPRALAAKLQPLGAQASRSILKPPFHSGTRQLKNPSHPLLPSTVDLLRGNIRDIHHTSESEARDEDMESTGKRDQGIGAALLAKAHSADDATRIFAEKVQQRPLFLTPSSPPPSDARAARRRAQEKKREQRKKALKPKPLSATQRRKLGLYDVPRKGQKYSVFEPLHNLWVGYIHEVLGSEIYTGGEAAAAKLASADFHGAEVEVVRSGCVSRVGIKGIVIKDSKFTFEVITRKNRLKLVPKEGTVFRLEVPAPKQLEGNNQVTEPAQQDQPESMVVEIHGEQFQFRSADRASKKFRTHFSKLL